MTDGTMPFNQKIHVDAAPADGGMTPALSSLLMNQGKTEGMSASEIAMLTGGGAGGMNCMNNPLLWLITLGFLGRGGGLLGGGDTGGALAASNLVGNPSVLEAVNAGNLSNCKSFGDAARDLATATITISDRVTTGLNAAQLQSANGFAATALGACQTQNQISQSAGQIELQQVQSQNAIQQQLATCCCENRLATANLTALINDQTCQITTAVHADGEATRALITSNRIADLQAQLNDAKSALRDQTILDAIAAKSK